MAFDTDTRSRLQRFVAEARKLLTDEFTRQLQGEYGLDPASGRVSDSVRSDLTPQEQETGRILRETLEHYRAQEKKPDNRALLDRIVREQAFTVLNRISALRMAESRGILIESVGQGYNSRAFQLYRQLAGPALGKTGDAYRIFLLSLFDEFAVELGSLFDRKSPQGRLFPSDAVLTKLFDLINSPELAPLWSEDETIGWIYQYFNSKEERKKMREQSAAPRNSRELAVRNQFFTPRYVVEFLTDNTLGRTWVEMTKGNTTLTESCRYLVKRPVEIFLSEGEPAPESSSEENEEASKSQEELLKEPLYVLHRPVKDPREITMLDPACGSMHFGLYAFDLYLAIYREYWEIEPGLAHRPTHLPSFHETYETKTEFLIDVPRLIIEYNIHGIDIDPRAVQIAGLSLWLRAQREWSRMDVKQSERPVITQSHVVCAEPMPGEENLLRDFVERSFGEAERPLFYELLKKIFSAMEIAGETGPLLKIEEEIKTYVEEAKLAYEKLTEQAGDSLFKQRDLNVALKKGEQQELAALEQALSTLSVNGEDFWQNLEDRIYRALESYAEGMEGGAYTRRLFARDTAHGFAFIDLCRKRYDVVLMNPPFGELSSRIDSHITNGYFNISGNILCAFIERCLHFIVESGKLASVIDRTILIKNSYEKFRRKFFLDNNNLELLLDLGWGVLDANVEVSSFVSQQSFLLHKEAAGIDVSQSKDKEFDITQKIGNPKILQHNSIKKQPFSAINFNIPEYFMRALEAANATSHDWRFSFFNGHTIKSDVFKRLIWEVPYNKVGELIKWMWNGSEYSPYYTSFQECVLSMEYAGGLSNHPSTIIRNNSHHEKYGLCYGKRGDFLDVQIIPNGFILTNEGFAGHSVGSDNSSALWYLLVYYNSLPIQVAINYFCGQHKGVGYVNAVPVIKGNSAIYKNIISLSKQIYNWLRQLNCASEVDPLFVSPFSINGLLLLDEHEWSSEYRNQSNEIQSATNYAEELIADILNISQDERDYLKRVKTDRPVLPMLAGVNGKNNSSLLEYWIGSLIHYSLGIAFGRWDIRFATGEKEAPELPDPFAALPVCPPGMLQNSQGLPVTPDDEKSLKKENYPIEFPWDGILVDDPGHERDIETRIHRVMQTIWNDRWESVEQEACDILGVQSLRDYLRRPGGFFADHLKRYSKSRRQAPIYWPLSTPSGGYTLWIYYQRLNDQTLFTCVNDFLEPKIRRIEEEIKALRSEQKGKKGAASDAVSGKVEFLTELQAMRNDFLKFAELPFRPDLNDGVVITAAPLWKYFQLTKWKNTLKETWTKLESGEYDWAHMAYAIWPERVKGKCKTDKSLAIAHGLEELYVEPVSEKKAKKTGKKAVKKAEIQPLLDEGE